MLTFITCFVFFQGFDFLSNLAKLVLDFKKQRFDPLVRSCVKIVGSIDIVTFRLGVGNSRAVIIVCSFLRGGSAQCGKKEEEIYRTQHNTKANHCYQLNESSQMVPLLLNDVFEHCLCVGLCKSFLVLDLHIAGFHLSCDQT